MLNGANLCPIQRFHSRNSGLRLRTLAPRFFRFVRTATLFLRSVSGRVTRVRSGPINTIFAFCTRQWRTHYTELLRGIIDGKRGVATKHAHASSRTINSTKFTLGIWNSSILAFRIVGFISGGVLRYFALRIFPLNRSGEWG